MQNIQNNSGFVLVKTVVLILSAIIIVLVLLLAYRSATIQARNAQRLADISQIQAALKLFYDYNRYYPEAVSKQPKDITDYLEFWPKAPTPADGICNSQVNEYVYEQVDRGESYSLSFCIGQNTNDIPAGYYKVGP
jgi:hypothetical protein